MMSLTTHSALTSLATSAKPVQDPRHSERIGHVQALLGDDLKWVEEHLRQVGELGELPAPAVTGHLLGQGGKRVRPSTTLLGAACVGEITPAVRELALVTELVHSATLLHDDVIDDGMERRGAPTARLMWGNAVSVLSGDVLLVHSLQRTQAVAPELMPDLLSTLFQLVGGEIVQLRGRTELDVSAERYDQILLDKTASLFRFAARAGAALAGGTVEQQNALGCFGEQVGMAFQLVDDLLDYTSEATGKTLCADLREGKITLPLVLTLQREPAWLPVLKRIHSGDSGEIEALRAAVVGSGACEVVRRRAERCTLSAVEALRTLPATPARTLLVAVAHQLARRAA